ncbi:hypothetical protein O3P69_015278 [Scylla paramamosain]|uniref:Uncharacterized protein n=1 Tax=Scylla paramamosain TaxID=85552 RepID=A0AAW0T5J0_SCYPA
MAGRPRFHTTTSRAPRTPRTPGVPSSHLATTLEMQQALMAMQQALARRSPASRVPTSATPEKCEAEMSTASFRSWRRSAECWNRGPHGSVCCGVVGGGVVRFRSLCALLALAHRACA